MTLVEGHALHPQAPRGRQARAVVAAERRAALAHWHADRATVRVAVVGDAFRADGGRTPARVLWRAGLTIWDTCPEALRRLGRESLVVAVDGLTVDGTDWGRALAPGQQVVWTPRMLGVETVIGLAVLAVSVAISAWSAYDANRRATIQAHHAARRAARISDIMRDSLTYGWEGIANGISPGRVVPVLYGRHRVGGQYVFAVVRKDAKGRSVLDAVVIVGEGEWEGMEAGSIEINGAPSSEFPKVTFENRRGTDDQFSPDTLLWPPFIVRTTVNPNAVFATQAGAPYTSPYVSYVSQPNRTGFALTIKVLPGAPDKRMSGWVKFDFDVRLRSYPSGSFGTPIQFTTGYVGLWPIFFSTGSPPVHFQIPQQLTDRYELEIRVAAVTLKGVAVGVTWPQPGVGKPRIVLSEVQEVEENIATYPGRALLALSAVASDKLGGGLPTVTSVWKGVKVRVYTAAPGAVILTTATGATDAGADTVTDGSVDFVAAGVVAGDKYRITAGADPGAYWVRNVVSPTQLQLSTMNGSTPSFGGGACTAQAETTQGLWTTKWSRNPAWCILDVLCHPGRGGGRLYTYHLDCVIADFLTAAAWCDRFVSRGVTGNVKSGTGGSVPTPGGDEISVDAGSALNDDTVRPEDLFVIDTGALAGSYLVDEVLGPELVRVTDTAGDPVSLAGVPVFDWHIAPQERAAHCDLYFDGDSTIHQSAQTIATNARLLLMRPDGRWRLRPEKAETVVQLFTMGNIIQGTYRHYYQSPDEVANRIESQFADEDGDWAQATAVMEDPEAFTNEDPVIASQVEYYGVTRRTEVLRSSLYQYLHNRYLEIIEFEANAAAVAVTLLDVFAFAHDVRPVNAALETIPGGRVVAGSTTSVVRLDRQVRIPQNADLLTVQAKATALLQSETIIETAGTQTDRLTMSAPLGTAPAEGDVWLLGSATIPNPLPDTWRVVGLTRAGTGRRKIRAVRYVDALYTIADDIGAYPTFND